MASSTSASVLDWTPEKFNGFKLRRLVIDGGTQALRNVLQKCHPGKSIQAILAAEKHKISSLKGKLINQTQWDVLYPKSPNVPDINNFDITLLSILLRNICGLATTGWGKMPNANDLSDKANIVRVRLFRNEVHAHIPETGVSMTYFEDYWKKISAVLVSLGIDQAEIDKLKTEECKKEVVERVMNEWNAMVNDIREDLKRIETAQKIANEEVKEKLQGIERMVTDLYDDRKRPKPCDTKEDDVKDDPKRREQTKPNRSNEALKRLACCGNFKTERETLCSKYVKGTREWVLRQVEDWFENGSPEYRAFIVTGEAGMGKSVIAAIICERMNQYLAGCHFFSYNNARYRDPKIFLQSLAVQLCNVLPEFKDALVDQLSRNTGSQNINEINIEGLFTLLLKEPFEHVSPPGKNILFVIDGVDESCDSEARSDLVDLIATHLVQLPEFIRFLITTRPEKNIVAKFEPLKPFYLKKDDKNNIADLRTFFQSKLSIENVPTENFYELLSRSDGNMLYAHFLFEIFQEKNNHEDLKNLPKGLTHVFEMYFRRLETECKTALNVNEETFLSLLSAMVASRKPLPLDFVVSIFGIKSDTPSEKRNRVKALNCISLLFVITDNRVSFFHKSVKDWLVSEDDHVYKISEKEGHVVLAKLCSDCFDNVLKTTDLKRSLPILEDAEKFAFEHGFYHMLKDDNNVKNHANLYLKNLELIHGCAMSVPNIEEWWFDIEYNTRIDWNQLDRNYTAELGIIVLPLKDSYRYERLFSGQYPKSAYLQGIITWPRQILVPIEQEHIPSKASELYASFYPELPYLERVSEHRTFLHAKEIELRPKEVGFSSHQHESYLSTEENHLSSADVRNIFDYAVLCFQNSMVVLISIKSFTIIWKKDFTAEEISCSCISFHPYQDIILPGRLDQVLSLTDGSWQRGPFSCAENSFFTECCFSPDNSIMITGNHCDTSLVFWDLVSGEKRRCIDVGGPVGGFSFSPNGNYFALVNAHPNASHLYTLLSYSVFDVRNNYTLLPNDTTDQLEGKEISVTGYKSESWLVFDGKRVHELYHNGLVFKSRKSTRIEDFRKLFFPPSTKTNKIDDISITSQVTGNLEYFRYIFLCNNRLGDDQIFLNHMLQITIFASHTLKLLDNKLSSGNISFDGQYFYQNFQFLRELRVLKRNFVGWIFINGKILHNIIAFAVVKNGVFVLTVQGSIEIWNFDMSARVMARQLLNAIECCESVSDYLIACVGKTEVSFIDSRNLQVVSTTSVYANQRVLACSSKYHVLVVKENNQCFIMRNDKTTHSVNNTGTVKLARFSPSGSKLLLFSNDLQKYYCYDISENSLTLVWNLRLPDDMGIEMLYFLEDEYFIAIFTPMQTVLSLTCAHSGKVLTCLKIYDHPTSVFYCRETQIVIVNYRCGGFKEFRVHWPKRGFVKS